MTRKFIESKYKFNYILGVLQVADKIYATLMAI